MKAEPIAASVIEVEVTDIADKQRKVWFISTVEGRRILAVEGMASLLMDQKGVSLIDLIKAGCDIITGRNILSLISRLSKSHEKTSSRVSNLIK